jgi:type IV secretory pathway VirB10-like protein
MPEAVNPETQHEKSDVNVRALLWFAAIFVIFGALTYGVVLLMFRHFAQMARNTATTPLTEIARPADANVPQTPRLQPFPMKQPGGAITLPNTSTPAVDMEEMRVTEEQALNNPGWVDRQKGIVRLPINVAKELAVQRLNTPAGAHP